MQARSDRSRGTNSGAWSRRQFSQRWAPESSTSWGASVTRMSSGLKSSGVASFARARQRGYSMISTLALA